MTKPTKWVCAQRRLRSAWAFAQNDQSSLCAHLVAKEPSFLHVDSEDSDQTRLICVFSGCTLILLVLSCHGSYILSTWSDSNEQSIYVNVCITFDFNVRGISFNTRRTIEISASLSHERMKDLIGCASTSSSPDTAWMLGSGDGAGKLPVPGRPTTLAYGRAAACCACSRWGRVGCFLFYFILSIYLPFLMPHLMGDCCLDCWVGLILPRNC